MTLRIYFSLLISLTTISQPLSAFAETAETQSQKNSRPKIGLVLKGGGALGFAHVGVIKVLEKYRVPVDYIAGTSMGSIVGASYATGLTVAEMEKVLTETDWGELFGEKIRRKDLDYRLKTGRQRELYGDVKFSIQDGQFVTPLGVVEGQNIRLLFQRMFGNLPSPVKFDDLPIPFRAVAADLETGEVYVPDSGDLSSAVRASMSIPGAFSPVELDGRLLVDGGIADNLPVDVALKMGADVLIVVDLQSDLAKRKDLTTPLSISGQMVSMLLMQNSALSLKLVRPGDVVIGADVNGYTVTDFPRGKELMVIGEKSAEASAELLKKFSLSEEQYALHQKKCSRPPEVPYKLAFVRINNDSQVSEERIRSKMQTKEGEAFNIDTIDQDMESLYQMGYFSTVTYKIVEENNQSGVVVDVNGRDWLDNYVRLGFSLEDNIDGEDGFRLGASFRNRNVTTRDSYVEMQGEIGRFPRFSVELYQPLTEDSPYFITPKAQIGKSYLMVRDGGTTIAQYDRESQVVSLALGRELGSYGEYIVGVSRGTGDVTREIGDPSLPEYNFDIADITTGFDLDTLDRPDFPSEGFRFATYYQAAVQDLGAPNNFSEINGILSVPFTFGRNTLVLRNAFVTTFGDRPVERSYALGGFLNVSGLPQNSLIASNYDSGGLLYFRRFSEVENPFFNLAFYGGLSYELTTIQNPSDNLPDYNLINSGSVFVGADTPLVPIYVGYGLNDIHDQSFYVAIGRLGQPPRQ